MNRRQVAPNLWQFALMPRDLVNVYLAGDVLIDAGGRLGARRLIGALGGHRVTAHALTHAHPDHQGASHAICDSLCVPLWCGQGDREAMEKGDLTTLFPEPDGWIARAAGRLAGPPQPVERVLVEGDRIADFEVVETPGHTPGHLAFWRESDRVLILGDVLFHRNPVTLRAGLVQPFESATFDPDRNRESAAKLAALEPAIVCFGHGEPLRDGVHFRQFVAGLGPR